MNMLTHEHMCLAPLACLLTHTLLKQPTTSSLPIIIYTTTSLYLVMIAFGYTYLFLMMMAADGRFLIIGLYEDGNMMLML